MKTKRQKELIDAFLVGLGSEAGVYLEIIMYLSEMGYNPKKEGQRISFKHDRHNKQIAKIGMTRGKNPSPVFMLRFSACKGYSQRFADIVKDAAASYTGRNCLFDGCGFCAGEPSTHVYTYTMPDGKDIYHCGAYALEIPRLSADDVPEIKALLDEEHGYLMEYEAVT